MVGLVIVAHSACLAQGVKELADQMVQHRVPIAIAGGLDDPENPFGTDAMKVLNAIQSVYSEDGVVILMDLGSALLSAEMALEFLPEEQQAHVYLSDAPLVEGAIAAAVRAATGGTAEEVLAEARTALQAKIAQLNLTPPPSTTSPTEAPVEGEEIRLTVRNRLGLHARPAAQFVTVASRYTADVHVRNVTRGTDWVNAKSINQVATLGVRQGHEIAIRAHGPDAEQALQALRELVEANFGEPEDIPTTVVPSTVPASSEEQKDLLTGIPASPGIALGPAHLYLPEPVDLPQTQVEDPETAWRQLEQALQKAREEIHRLRAQAVHRVGEYEAAIFDAHILFLEDPTLRERARELIFREHLHPAAAWARAIDEMIGTYRALDDPYMQARAADLEDVKRRVLRLLLGTSTKPPHPQQPSILIAEDLTPSDTAQLDPKMVLGIATALGGATSHTAILARALGIPAVVGLGLAILRVEEGQEIGLDGSQGRVWLRLTPEIRRELEERRRRWLAEQEDMRRLAQAPAQTRDGHRVEIGANIIGVADAAAALQYGAEGIGLMRTEFLFVDRESPPDEEEQWRVYQQVADLLGKRPLVIRTVDVGGDKPIPYLQLEPEPNPFLGWRGIRLTLERPDLLKTQFRAILRASVDHNIKIMLPMVSTLEEVRAARALFQEAQDELRRAGQPFDEGVELGIMVEIPAAALMAEKMAREVDFFSVGTNDLSQYTMAADRTNARVAHLADGLQPAVLRLIDRAARAAHEAGIWIGVCGEIAGDAVAAPILVGLGVDELSMNPPAIPRVKQVLRQWTWAEMQELAQKALDLESAEQVRQLVSNQQTSNE
ncbi:MAG: phosphoenolpyruvate--protein phosphotransferase [Chloroflexi bacterium]|nr:phosphoenolpyruvate--protein phosphotransferase [Chloroflexota bacterium]